MTTKTTCPSCERTHERTAAGVRPIQIGRDGVCGACRDAAAEARA